MPLVIPGLQSSSGSDKTTKWQNDLMGKKIGDASDQVVRAFPESCHSLYRFLCFAGAAR